MQYILSKLVVNLVKIFTNESSFIGIKYKCLSIHKFNYFSLAFFFQIYYLNKNNIKQINQIYLEDYKFNISDKDKKILIKNSKNLGFNLASIYPSDAIFLWHLIKKYKINNFIETGTGFGYSTVLIHEGLKLYNHKIFNLNTFGFPKIHQKKYSKNLFKNYPKIKYHFGFVPKILINSYLSKKKNTAFFIDGPKGSSKEFEETLKFIFLNFSPEFVAIHDCEYHLPPLYINNFNKRLNYTRSKLVYFFHKNLSKSNYKLMFLNNKNYQYFQNLDNSIFRFSNKIGPYFFKNAKNLSYSPGIGVIVKKN